MNRALLIVCVLASCKSEKSQPTAGSAPVAVAADAAPDAAGLDVCALGRTALAGATCPTPEVREQLMAAKRSLDGIVDTIGQVAAANPQQFQVACAQLLIAIERDAAKANCTLALDPARRAEVVQLLEAWYAQRTPVVPTGDAAADAVIAKIAAMRDAACACDDAACLDRVDKQLLAIGEMPQTAPDAARTLGSKLLEDAARCANRVRTLTDPK